MTKSANLLIPVDKWAKNTSKMSRCYTCGVNCGDIVQGTKLMCLWQIIMAGLELGLSVISFGRTTQYYGSIVCVLVTGVIYPVVLGASSLATYMCITKKLRKVVTIHIIITGAGVLFHTASSFVLTLALSNAKTATLGCPQILRLISLFGGRETPDNCVITSADPSEQWLSCYSASELKCQRQFLLNSKLVDTGVIDSLLPICASQKDINGAGIGLIICHLIGIILCLWFCWCFVQLSYHLIYVEKQNAAAEEKRRVKLAARAASPWAELAIVEYS